MKDNKFYIEAEIKLQEETIDLQKTVASIIDLPKEGEKQPDLLYFSAIFVSSGANLNGAHFLPTELVKAEGTIISKALDIEHKEDEIIGHIYDRAFMDHDGNKLDVKELANIEEGALNAKNMHVVIAGVIYKNRFPNVAQEISNKKLKISMECYYANYDVKIGNLVMTRKDAEAMGLANDDRMFTRFAKVIKKGKEVAEGQIERILRGICFSGCGVVKNPANPPSVILETANQKPESKEVIILDYDKLEKNNLTSVTIEGQASVTTEKKIDETNTGIDPVALRVSIRKIAKSHAQKLLKQQKHLDRREELLANLNSVLERANKLN